MNALSVFPPYHLPDGGGFRTDKNGSNLLEMVDCGVNLADSFSEFIGCQSIVFAESVLKIKQLVLEVGYIDVLSKNKY